MVDFPVAVSCGEVSFGDRGLVRGVASGGMSLVDKERTLFDFSGICAGVFGVGGVGGLLEVFEYAFDVVEVYRAQVAPCGDNLW